MPLASDWTKHATTCKDQHEKVRHSVHGRGLQARARERRLQASMGGPITRKRNPHAAHGAPKTWDALWDGDVHTTAKEWLRQKKNGGVEPWPAHSPDTNNNRKRVGSYKKRRMGVAVTLFKNTNANCQKLKPVFSDARASPNVRSHIFSSNGPLSGSNMGDFESLRGVVYLQKQPNGKNDKEDASDG